MSATEETDVGSETPTEGSVEATPEVPAWDIKNISDQVTAVANNNLSSAGVTYDPVARAYYYKETNCFYYPDQRAYYYPANNTYYYYCEENNSYIPYSAGESTQSYAMCGVISSSSTVSSSSSVQKSAKIISNASATISRGAVVDTSRKQMKPSEETKAPEAEEEEEEEEEEEIPPEFAFMQNFAIDNDKSKTRRKKKKKAIDPCIRIIAVDSPSKRIPVGMLFIVTRNGAKVGRLKSCDVFLEDSSVSKNHAEIKYVYDRDISGFKYIIIDRGSSNGTFINDVRLSKPLKESQPYPLNHGDMVRVGDTKLLYHIHDAYETCPDCEPSTYEQKDDKYAGQASAPLTEQFKTEKNRIRKKFGLEEKGEGAGGNYNDRAEKRRGEIGSSHHAEKTQVASVEESIPTSNKGYGLLLKMGWKEGEGLGTDPKKGTLDPICPDSNYGTTGLGSSGTVPIQLDHEGKKKLKVLMKTQERYNAIDTSDEWGS